MESHKKVRPGLWTGILPFLLVVTVMAGLMPARADAAVLVVTTTADPGVGGCTLAGDGDGCTLREAIIDANNQTLTPGDDFIDATGVTGAITLLTALPAITTNIVLNGPGAGSLTVERSSAGGTPEFRIFSIDNGTTSGPTVGIFGFTISNGRVSGIIAPANSGGAIYNNHGTLTVSNNLLTGNSATNGGAICNDGSVSPSAILSLSNSNISNNTATSGGGAIFNNGSNGGSAPVTISNSAFISNSATDGGAILNDGHNGGSATITQLTNSVLGNNTASGNGGGINNNGRTGGSATLVISYSTVSSNSAINGGGIHNDGVTGSATQAISYSTFSNNTASANGGAFNNDGRSAGSATLAIDTSTLFGNTAAEGGAILNDGTGAGASATVEIDNSTLKSNTVSGNSAAIDSDGTAGSATLALGSTILDNGPSDNLALTTNSETTFTSKNHNLSSDEAGGDSNTGPGGPYLSAGGDIRNTDPLLDPAGLQPNGGPTLTIALLVGSPAIDQGLSGSLTDQRGAPRPLDNPAIVNASGGDGSDIGAYELQDTTQNGPNFVVNTTNDNDDGACSTNHCSLREAINAANGDPDASIITFASTVFANEETILLTSALNNLSSDITINGPASGVTIQRSSGGLYSILRINIGTTVFLNKLTLSNGQNDANGGGGLFNQGTVTLTDCTISGNSSTNAGGGLYSSGGTTTLTNCTISGNTCNTIFGFSGGGMDSSGSGTLTLTNCTFSGNTASDGGQGSVAGGLWISSNATITNCTFTNNFASGTSSAGGIRVEANTTTISNSIVAGNSGINGATPDVNGTFTSNGFNLIGATDGSTGFTASGDQTGTTANPLDAKLGTLSNNGGLTQTIPLLNGSPAINSGDTALTTDQRGVARPQGSADDIGAFEVAALSVATTSVIEGNGGSVNLVFTVTLATASSQPVTVDFNTADGSTFPATFFIDYTPRGSTLTFNPGDTTKTVTVTVLGDTLDEFNERVALVLFNPQGAVIGTVNEGVIIDNDPAPTMSINDVQVTEGNGGTVQAVFTVTLSAISAKTITVTANTGSSGGSPVATPGTDYAVLAGKIVTFQPGQLTQSVSVSILGDLSDEQDEKFTVGLSAPVNATISDNTGVGTILDNDAAPVITGSAPNVTEGDAGTATMIFTLKLSAPSGRNVTVQVKTANSGTFPATSGSDYVPVPLSTITFLAGQTTATVNVTVNGDTLDEVNERIALALSNSVNATIGTVTDGIIVDDDATPSLSINDASLIEGNAGTSQMVFTVTLSAASGQTVTVNAQTGGGGNPAATPGNDYLVLSATPITFAPGQTTKQVSITINGDTVVEQNEKLGVTLSGATGATIADNTGIGIITNDDGAPAPAPTQSPEEDDSK